MEERHKNPCVPFPSTRRQRARTKLVFRNDHLNGQIPCEDDKLNKWPHISMLTVDKKNSREQRKFSHTDWEDWVGHQASAAEQRHLLLLLLLYDLEVTHLSQAWSDCRMCGRGSQWRLSQWWRCRRWRRVMPWSSCVAWPCLQCQCVIVLQSKGIQTL